jgi:hypothetical protein
VFDRQLDGGFQESQLIARVVALADVVKALDLLILEQRLDRVRQLQFATGGLLRNMTLDYTGIAFNIKTSWGTNCLKCLAGSTGRCNTGLKFTRRGLKAQPSVPR